MAERTGVQLPGVATSLSTSALTARLAKSYKTYREMRLDPTIALARRLVIAPVMLASWSFESESTAPEGAKLFIEEQLKPFRIHILRTTMLGNIDFGWQAYEKVWAFDAIKRRYTLKKLKPLIQDNTDILVDPDTGAFTGLRQYVNGKELDLSVAESLHIALDVEGTDWYGQPAMEVARKTYSKWNNVEAAADRYDRKIAGSHWVVHYPRGQSMYNGTLTDNFEIAKKFIATLEASGTIAVPRQVQESLNELGEQQDAWRVELLSDTSGATGTFIERQRYLDALKVRAIGLPERAVLEGQFGTKAEAEAHADLAISDMEVRHQIICQHLNWHLVNPMLRYNYGEETENSVYVQPSPIADLDRIYLRDLYKTVLTNPNAFDLELSTIDTEALKDRLGIPIQPTKNIDLPGVVPVERAVDDDQGLLPLDEGVAR